MSRLKKPVMSEVLRVRVGKWEAREIRFLADLSDPRGQYSFTERVERVLLLAVRDLLGRAAREIPELAELRALCRKEAVALDTRARNLEVRRVEALERRMMGGAGGRRIAKDIPIPKKRLRNRDRIEAERLSNLRVMVREEKERREKRRREERREMFYRVVQQRGRREGGLMHGIQQRRAKVRRERLAVLELVR